MVETHSSRERRIEAAQGLRVATEAPLDAGQGCLREGADGETPRDRRFGILTDGLFFGNRKR